MAVERTLLLIADIGGYTRFMKLHAVSLAHAHDMVSRLIETVIDAARPELTLASNATPAPIRSPPTRFQVMPWGNYGSIMGRCRRQRRRRLRGR